MDLVTVACNRDFKQVIHQAESIQKFVKPCRHVIIVNEDEVDLAHWNNTLSSYYIEHKLVIVQREHIPYFNKVVKISHNHQQPWGWKSQQVYKLMISKQIDDYLILDSKDFFVKEFDTESFRNVPGNGYLISRKDIHPCWHKTIKAYAEIFGRDILDNFLNLSPPFHINSATLKEFNKYEDLPQLLLAKGIVPSEGLFYSYLAEDAIRSMPKHHLSQTLNIGLANIESDMENLEEILFGKDFDTRSVFSFHHTFLQKINQSHVDLINKKMEQLGFAFKYELWK